jgi:hypothetical protein
MKALCIEGVATRDDPEPCVGVRKGADEASVGAHVGRAIDCHEEGPPPAMATL